MQLWTWSVISSIRPAYTDILRVAFASEFERGRLQDLVSLLSGRNFETRQYEEDMAAASLEDILMPTIQIELPDEMLLSLKETPEGLSKMIRMAAAAKLYELGKLSSGRAADLAGLPRVSFLQALGQYGVSIFTLTKEEFAQDLRNA